MIACPLVTYVIVILRFYRSCYGDEGYLTQTLPVSGKQIYFSKLLVGLLLVPAEYTIGLFVALQPYVPADRCRRRVRY